MGVGELEMPETTAFKAVTQIRMSRELDGKPVCRVAARLVNGLPIDQGSQSRSVPGMGV